MLSIQRAVPRQKKTEKGEKPGERGQRVSQWSIYGGRGLSLGTYGLGILIAGEKKEKRYPSTHWGEGLWHV